MSLYEPENLYGDSMSRIFSHFGDPRLKMDLRKAAPEDIHEKIDSDKLLREYETVLGRSEEQVVELPLHELAEPDSAKLPPLTRGRGGGFSALARNAIHSGLETSKKMVKNGATLRNWSSSQGNEDNTAWRSRQSIMEADANNWRTRNLAGIPFSNSRFSELRSKHIHQRVPELESNGRK
jgi:hypothetical protein